MSKIILTDEGSTPATPSAGTTVVYTQAGVLYTLTSSGSPVAPLSPSIFTATGQMLYASAPGTAAALAIGTAGQYLRVNAGATAPEWFSLLGATVPTALGGAGAAGSSASAARVDHVHAFPVSATGDLLYANAATTVTNLGIGAGGQFLRVNAGIPAWQTVTAGDVGAIPTSALTASNPASLAGAAAPGASTDVARLDHVHPFPTASDVSAVALSTVTTAGDLIYATGAGAVTRRGIGTVGQVLAVNAGATAPVWQNPPTFVAGPTSSTAQFRTATAITDAITAAAAAISGGLPNAVVEILPGSYTPGAVTLPANVSLKGLGGLGDVQITGNITCTAAADGNTLSNLYLNGRILCNSGVPTVASVIFDNCVIESGGSSPIEITDSGWGLTLTNCTVKVTVAAIDVVTGPADPATATVTAENCTFTSTAGGVGVRTFNGSFSSLDFVGCYFSHPLNMTTVAGSSVSLRDCTLNFAPNTPATAFSFAAGASPLNIFGSFSLTSLVAAGTLYTGGAVTARAFAGVFLGTYQFANLPVLSGDNGVLAYTSDANALYVLRSGAWEKVASESNATTWTATQTFNETVFNRAANATAVNAGAVGYAMADNTVAPLIRMDVGAAPKTVTLFDPSGGDAGKQWVIFDAARDAGVNNISISVPLTVTLNGGVAGVGYPNAITTNGGAIVVRVVGASAWETIGY